MKIQIFLISILVLLSSCSSPEDMMSEDMMSEDMMSEDMMSEDMMSEDMTSEDMMSEDMMSEDMMSEDMTSEDMTSEDMTSEDMDTSCDVVCSDLELFAGSGVGGAMYDSSTGVLSISLVEGALELEWLYLTVVIGSGNSGSFSSIKGVISDELLMFDLTDVAENDTSIRVTNLEFQLACGDFTALMFEGALDLTQDSELQSFTCSQQPMF